MAVGQGRISLCPREGQTGLSDSKGRVACCVCPTAVVLAGGLELGWDIPIWRDELLQLELGKDGSRSRLRVRALLRRQRGGSSSCFPESGAPGLMLEIVGSAACLGLQR